MFAVYRVGPKTCSNWHVILI